MGIVIVSGRGEGVGSLHSSFFVSLSLASVGFEQAWGLDGLGNFATFQEDSDGQGWDLEQERDVNAANEITGIDEGQYQDAWITPEYDVAGNDAAGNMIES